MDKKKIFSFIIFIISLSILNIDVLGFVAQIKNQLGQYIYPLDDAYIHLSISKNIAEHGIWGITQYQFSSTSSSPLFTLVLASLIKILGNDPFIPLYINIVLGNLLMLVIYINFRKRPLQLIFIYFVFILGVLMKVQMVSGMEHALQLLLICSCWIYFYKWHQTGFLNKIFRNVFYVTVSLLCITRYESLFFVTPLVAFLFLSKKYKVGAVVALLAYAPIIIFGIYSINEGGHFFPNSLLVKGKHSFTAESLIQNLFVAKSFIVSNFYLYLIIILILFLLSKYQYHTGEIFKSVRSIVHENLIYAIVFITVVGHLMFAMAGWLYRYDAYLIALLVLSVAFAVDKVDKHINYSVIVTVVIFSVLLVEALKDRYQQAEGILKYANKNIHDQQIQMSKFVRKHFNRSTIVANDIGAITYFTDIKLHDLVGLGSTDILDMKKYHPNQFDDYVNALNYDLMIVYDNWFYEINFTNRNKIAQLIIQNNEICGGDVVNFYLPNESENKEYAYRALEDFKKEIPADVQLNIFYSIESED